MSGICEGRIAIVTGAGRGIGREHALMLASEGAKVVVNDLGGEMDGTGKPTEGPALEVVEEIEGLGSEAVANGDDVSSWEGAQRLVNTAVETFGGLDVLINNAGILRDRMLTNMTEDEWDAVIKVHMKGTYAPTRWAAAYWRERTKAGDTNDARIINTTSPSGLFGNVGQTNYAAAKAGIAAFTQVAALELARYGVTANCLAPVAFTRMTENLMPGEMAEGLSPRWIAVTATWLASPEAAKVTGRVFHINGENLGIAEGWHLGPVQQQPDEPSELKPIVADLMKQARLNSNMFGGDAEGDGYPGHEI